MLPKRWLSIMLASLVSLYVTVFSYLSLINHRNFGTFGFDLGIFDQGVWLLSRGKPPFITVRGLNLFGDHLSFILLAVVPFYRLWADPQLLLLLQTAALGAGAVPVFLLARERLQSNSLAISLAASYLLYPALEWINYDQFHPESFAVPCLLFALYFAERTRFLAFALATVLALLIKEDVALIAACMGIYVALRYNRTVGIATCAASLAWFVVSIRVILPHFNQAGFFYISNYSRLGSTPAEVITTAMTNPGLLLSIIGQPVKLTYLVQLFAPVLFIPVIAIGLLAVAGPALFSNLISQQGYMDSIQYHYTALIIPFVFAATIAALKKLDLTAQLKRVCAGALLLAALVANITLSPSPLSSNFADHTWSLHNDRRAVIERALGIIPRGAVVSAHHYMVPHLSHRDLVYEFPNPFIVQNWGIRGENPVSTRAIEYIVVDERILPQRQRTLVNRLKRNGFSERFNLEDIVVLKRD